MHLLKFEEMFKNNNGIPLTDKVILWKKPLHLWYLDTGEEVHFKSLQEVYSYKLGNETIQHLIERTNEFILHYDGQGSSSQMGGGFGHAGGGGGGNNQQRLSVEFNGVIGASNSYQKALELFEKKYQNADHEYGIAVDDLGYTYRHVEGGTTSVAISGGKGQTIIHNHPNSGWGNFSDSDLLSIAMGGEKAIVATGNRMRVTFTKTNKFDAVGFSKAVKKAQWPVKMNYDQGADWWLKRNQSKYGYTYEGVFRGINN